jgi:hypothetical protein
MLPQQLSGLGSFPRADDLFNAQLRDAISQRYRQDFGIYRDIFGIDLLTTGRAKKARKFVEGEVDAAEKETVLYPTPGALAYADTPAKLVDQPLKVAEYPQHTANHSRRRRRAQPHVLDRIPAAQGAKFSAELDELTFDREIRVSAAEPAGLSDAMKQALAWQAEGHSTRVLLAPGLYRDSVALSQRNAGDGVILIDAEEPGTAVLTGSDQVTQISEHAGFWRIPWHEKWGLGSAPPDYGDPNLRVADLMRRREMVTLNGEILRQVLHQRDLAAGCFRVDEDKEEILLIPPAGVVAASADLEVAIRSVLLRLSNCSNVAIRGLSFCGDSSGYYVPQRAALHMSNCENVLINDCEFRDNNNKGLQIDGESRGITLQHSRFIRNGCLGFLATSCDNLLLENVETCMNNWRGAWAAAWRGSPSGFKIMKSNQVTVRRLRSLRNDATGAWFDEENSNVRIEDSVFFGNRRGLHLEASAGPFLVRRCSFMSNRQEPLPNNWRWSFGSGLALTHVADVCVTECEFGDNDVAQLGVRVDRETRRLVDTDTGEVRIHRTQNIALYGNRIISTSPHRALLRLPNKAFDDGRFWVGFRAADNLYLVSSGLAGFAVADASTNRSEKMCFDDWLAFSNLDEGSNCFEQ